MIRVGLIGYGNYGKRYYDNIINDKKFKIIKILKKKNISSKLFTNNKKKFFSIKNIDLYIIASPTHTHFEYLNSIMRKNKHIIVEKPLVKSLEEYLKFKKNLKKFKKIILINHTDLNFKSFINIKKKIKKIGKIKSVTLNYGKKDPYLIKNINQVSDLPFYEWLPHPLAVINDLFRNDKFQISIKEKKLKRGRFLFQNLQANLNTKKIYIKIYFSNNYKYKKRNLVISGSKGSLIFKGYNNKKAFHFKNNKKINISKKNDDPIANLLDNFNRKFSQKKSQDDRKIICKTTIQLFDILNKIE